MRIAELLARRSLHSFAWSKKFFNDSFETGFETQIERERSELVTCGASGSSRSGCMLL